jgi:hypothetical protein
MRDAALRGEVANPFRRTTEVLGRAPPVAPGRGVGAEPFDIATRGLSSTRARTAGATRSTTAFTSRHRLEASGTLQTRVVETDAAGAIEATCDSVVVGPQGDIFVRQRPTRAVRLSERSDYRPLPPVAGRYRAGRSRSRKRSNRCVVDRIDEGATPFACQREPALLPLLPKRLSFARIAERREPPIQRGLSQARRGRQHPRVPRRQDRAWVDLRHRSCEPPEWWAHWCWAERGIRY